MITSPASNFPGLNKQQWQVLHADGLWGFEGGLTTHEDGEVRPKVAVRPEQLALGEGRWVLYRGAHFA